MSSVLQVCAYAAPYPGNFIASLITLESELKKQNIHTIYAFAEGAKNQKWCLELQKRSKVYFLPVAKARILPKTYSVFRKIYQENDIKIVHSHFELYDIPATIMAPKTVKIFWHLHDPYQKSIKVSRNLLNKLQYSCFSKRATLLSVADYYRKEIVKLGFNEKNTAVVLNGIDLSRINITLNNRTDAEFDFLTFGWDFYRKGGDIILNVCNRLCKEGYKFKLLFNGNDNTWLILDKLFPEGDPDYLMRGEPVKDVNKLFRNAHIFIQASRRETFSYALCEAVYSGMQAISSDIYGVEWAKELPLVSFFETENEQQLYEQMKVYLEHKNGFSQDEICISQKIIDEKFSLEIWAKEIMSFYEGNNNYDKCNSTSI